MHHSDIVGGRCPVVGDMQRIGRMTTEVTQARSFDRSEQTRSDDGDFRSSGLDQTVIRRGMNLNHLAATRHSSQGQSNWTVLTGGQIAQLHCQTLTACMLQASRNDRFDFHIGRSPRTGIADHQGLRGILPDHDFSAAFELDGKQRLGHREARRGSSGEPHIGTGGDFAPFDGNEVHMDDLLFPRSNLAELPHQSGSRYGLRDRTDQPDIGWEFRLDLHILGFH